MQFQSNMCSLKSQPFVKSQRIYPLSVRRQLNHVTPSFLRSSSNPSNQLTADTSTASRPMDTNAFNRRSPPTLICQMRCDGQLCNSNRTIVFTGHNQLDIRIRANRVKRAQVSLRKRLSILLSRTPHIIIREHLHNCVQIFHCRLTKRHITSLHNPHPSAWLNIKYHIKQF